MDGKLLISDTEDEGFLAKVFKGLFPKYARAPRAKGLEFTM